MTHERNWYETHKEELDALMIAPSQIPEGKQQMWDGEKYVIVHRYPFKGERRGIIMG